MRTITVVGGPCRRRDRQCRRGRRSRRLRARRCSSRCRRSSATATHCGGCCCASRAAASPRHANLIVPGHARATAMPASSSWSRPSIRRCRAPTRSARRPCCSRRACVTMHQPETVVRLEAPGGVVEGARNLPRRALRIGRVHQRALASPSGLDASLEVEGLGTISVDVAYGGMFYAIAEGAGAGLRDRARRGARALARGRAHPRRSARAADLRPPRESRHPRGPDQDEQGPATASAATRPITSGTPQAAWLGNGRTRSFAHRHLAEGPRRVQDPDPGVVDPRDAGETVGLRAHLSTPSTAVRAWAAIFRASSTIVITIAAATAATTMPSTNPDVPTGGCTDHNGKSHLLCSSKWRLSR